MKHPGYFIPVLCATLVIPAHATAAGDANAGAKLVSQFGCAGCHGAGLKGGGVGPALYGIEHKLNPQQISDSIAHPKAPMPAFGLSNEQVADIVTYISGLDGGASGDKPVVTISSRTASSAVVSVRFPTPPHHATLVASMAMGGSTMHTGSIALMPTSDPHVYRAKVSFAMGGAWTLHVDYDDKHLEYPITVGG
jgi:cytochrome c553